ncbi:MAG: hypothetical protein R3E31_20485 [Chloroflexota bacterium]
MADWLPTTGGTYTLTAVMTNTLNTAVYDSINVHIKIQNCFTEYDGDTLADFASEDARAVQWAVDAAPVGSTIKIAGTCVGVQGNGAITQTVAISKSLTLIGGYKPDGDWATSQPDVYETVLDADGNGRVVTIIDAGAVTLKNLTLTGGEAVAPAVSATLPTMAAASSSKTALATWKMSSLRAIMPSAMAAAFMSVAAS